MLEPKLNTDMMRLLDLKEAHVKISAQDDMDIEVKYAVLASMTNEMYEIQRAITTFVKEQDKFLEQSTQEMQDV